VQSIKRMKVEDAEILLQERPLSGSAPEVVYLAAGPDGALQSRDFPHPHVVLESIIAQRFGVEYQPLVDVKNGRTFAHEALARFIDADGHVMRPDIVFALLHDNPLLLMHAELEMKALQLAEAPEDGLLFVNLDPDSFSAGNGMHGENVFLPCLMQYRQRLVVEVIENLHIEDVLRARNMIDVLEAAGVRLAIDDMSSSRGLISYASMISADYIKFDRSWLTGGLSPRQRTILTWVLAQAADLGLTTVLEGVETERDLAMARDFGFDLVQGFLFRPRFVWRGCTPRGE
jgi:EAL domain-containing protein (putative c-di-GMP-specific phosphodiesterase class I)